MAVAKAAATTVAIPIYDAEDPTALKSGLTPTCTVSGDGGAFAAATNSASELGATGVYALTLTAAEMDADLVTVKVTAAGACDQVLALVTDPSLAALATAAAVADLPTNAELATALAGADDAVLAAVAEVKVKTDQIGAAAVTVSSPVAISGTVTLHAGDDYDAAHGRAVEFAVADETHALGLDDAEAVVSFKATQATWTATSVTETADGYTVAFEPDAADTAALTLQRQSYELEAVLADGDTVTLATGTLAVERDIAAV
jgi:hypothetical protein